MPRIGGNSMRASSGMNATETDLQLKNGIIDSSEKFYNETFQAGGKMNDPQLLEYFTTHTNGAIEWLKQYDVDLGDLTTLGRNEFSADSPANGYFTNWGLSCKETRHGG